VVKYKYVEYEDALCEKKIMTFCTMNIYRHQVINSYMTPLAVDDCHTIVMFLCKYHFVNLIVVIRVTGDMCNRYFSLV
jgi:hypothetical protein